MIAHHPDETLLLAYASGAGDEAAALIIATHMALCADCRRTVAMAEKIGGGLLEDIAPAPLLDGALAATMARLDNSFEAPPRRFRVCDATPEPLRPYLGGALSSVRWRRMGPNLAYRTLLRRGPVRAKLLRGAPGTDVGTHSHRGLEYILVLSGGFRDETGSYGPGDFQTSDCSLIHTPVADPGEPCITLAVTTGPLRFENWLQKLAAPFFGF